MTNLIEQFFVSNVFSVPSPKKFAFKETMEWKNIFDKQMLDVFSNIDISTQENISSVSNNKSDSQQKTSFNKNVVPSSSVKENDYLKAPSVQNNAIHAAVSSGKEQVLIDKLTGFSYAANGLSVKDVQLQIRAQNMNSSSQLNPNRFSLSTFNQTMGRIHLAKLDSGIKLYARYYSMDDNDVLKILKGVIEKMKHSNIAIHEVRLNGKSIQI